jgi:hypothetical protein
MPYSLDIAEVLATQLDQLSKLSCRQLAGHIANLEFWLNEVKHCLEVLNGYRGRFEQLREAQKGYIPDHRSRVVEPEFHLPYRIPDDDLKSRRHELREAFYRFLIRLPRTPDGRAVVTTDRKCC